MSFSAMLEGKNSNSEGADQRIYADDERISLPPRTWLEKKFDDMTMMFLTKLAEFESKILKLELDINELSTSMKRNAEHDGHSFKERYLNLQFSADKISSPVRTGDEIKGVEGNYLTVALFNETGELVDSGPESSAEVRIFALKEDVNDENEGESGFCFDDTASEKKTKKAAILEGDVQLKLNKGTGILANIKFRSSSSHIRSGMFKIGARVVDSFHGVVVQDANTAPFRVRDYRGKYNEKHHPPCLSDEIWRLDNIGRRGSILNRLKNLNVDTVEDFLIQLLKDSEGLKQSVDLPPKKWEATVKHALRCQLDEKMYCSIHSEENSGIVFNAVGKVLGLIVESKYLPMATLSHEDKVNASKLDVASFVHKSGLYCFPDEASVLQHFPKLAEPSNPSQLTMSENAMGDVVSETAESHQMTNTVTLPEDVASCSRPLEIEEYFDIDSFLAASEYNQNTSFSDMLHESPAVVSDNEVKKKLFLFFTISKWFLNYERMAAAGCCCDGNGNQKRRRIS